VGGHTQKKNKKNPNTHHTHKQNKNTPERKIVTKNRPDGIPLKEKVIQMIKETEKLKGVQDSPISSKKKRVWKFLRICAYVL